MKKNLFKFISQIVFVVAGILMYLALIMPAFAVASSSKDSVDTYSRVITGVVIVPIILYVVIGLGIGLVSTKSEKNQTIGSSLILGAGFVNLIAFVSVINEISDSTVLGIGAGPIFGLIAFLLVVVAYILMVIDYIICKSNDHKDKDIETIMQWKELEKNEIISHDEFLAKRDAILNYKK